MITPNQKAYLKAQKAIFKAAKTSDKHQLKYNKAINEMRKVESKMTRDELMGAIQMVKIKK